MPGVVPGDYYVIVRSDVMHRLSDDNVSNNVLTSVDTVAAMVSGLPVDSAMEFPLTEGGFACFEIQADFGSTLEGGAALTGRGRNQNVGASTIAKTTSSDIVACMLIVRVIVLVLFLAIHRNSVHCLHTNLTFGHNRGANHRSPGDSFGSAGCQTHPLPVRVG